MNFNKVGIKNKIKLKSCLFFKFCVFKNILFGYQLTVFNEVKKYKFLRSGEAVIYKKKIFIFFSPKILGHKFLSVRMSIVIYNKKILFFFSQF